MKSCLESSKILSRPWKETSNRLNSLSSIKKNALIIGILLLLLLVFAACERESRRLDDLVDWDKHPKYVQNLESKIDDWVANKDCIALWEARADAKEYDDNLWYYINFFMWEIDCYHAKNPERFKFDVVR